MHLCVHLLVCQDSFQPKLGLLDAAKSLALAEMVQNKSESVTIPTQERQNGNGNGQKRERERPEMAIGTAKTVTGTVRSRSVPDKNGNYLGTDRNGPKNGRNGNGNGHGTGTRTGTVPVPVPWESRGGHPDPLIADRG